MNNFVIFSVYEEVGITTGGLNLVVLVSVMVFAESISQLGFWFRYWTLTKIVVSVVHNSHLRLK